MSSSLNNVYVDLFQKLHLLFPSEVFFKKYLKDIET